MFAYCFQYSAHYGVEYRLDVIDASTDAVRGTFVFTTQGILQEQRDILIAKQQGMHVSLVQCLFGPLKYTQKRRLKVELRAGVQSNRDFFAPPSGSTSRQRKEKKNVDTTATTTATTENDEKDNADETNAGAISGWMEIDVGLEEYTDRLYGLWRPYASPPRPPPEFNMINFQTHIARVKALIDDAKYAMDKYNYVISWKNSRLTGASLVIFCFLCLLFNAEYSGRCVRCRFLAGATKTKK